MDPDTPVSDEEFKVSFLSQNFRLEWTVPLEAFTNSNHVPRQMPEEMMESKEMYLPGYDRDLMENSKLFNFKELKIHPFYLELSKTEEAYAMRVVTATPKDGAKLQYAFVSIEDRLYYLTVWNTDGSIGFCKGKKLTPKTIEDFKTNVTIICGISAASEVRLSEDPPVDHLVLECSLARGLPAVDNNYWNHRFGGGIYSPITKYQLSGELPGLNVEMAKYLLETLSIMGLWPELKGVCVEYLMDNLSPGNVIDVWKLASDFSVKSLVDWCHAYVTMDCNVTKRS